MDNHSVEDSIRAAWEAGDFEAAVASLLSNYGDELLTFLIARMGYANGQEAFSLLCEDLWVGLPRFQWRCSLRTWSYTLARNAGHRYARAPHNRRERNLTLSRHAALSELAQEVRSRTTTYRRTASRDRLQELRDRLSPEDQTLLILHVDRRLPWRDLALVMLGDEGSDDQLAVEREASRLRKRFERVKVSLKRMAKEEGLLDTD